MRLEDVKILLTLTEKEMLILRYAMSQARFKAGQDVSRARSRSEKYDFKQFEATCKDLETKLMETEHATLRHYGLLKEKPK